MNDQLCLSTRTGVFGLCLTAIALTGCQYLSYHLRSCEGLDLHAYCLYDWAQVIALVA